MKQIDDQESSKAHTISKIFHYVGGTLVFFGILYLLFNNLFLLATASRILVTLGLAVWSLAVGVSLSKQANAEATSAVFYTIGGLLLPVGLGVTLRAMQLDFPYDVDNILITGICFAIFLILQMRFPREVLLLFCLFFGSSFFIACTGYLNATVFGFDVNTLFDYQLLVLGVFYFLLGYGASMQGNRLAGILYFVGDLLTLIAAFQLGGLLFEDNAIFIWEILAPVAILLSFAVSIPLKSNALLYLAGLFLIIYIVNLTRKFAYLFGSVEWPILLIVAGVVLMFIGYLFVRLQKNPPKK
jgi:hypothetical protein